MAENQVPAEPGAYTLIIRLDQAISIPIGRLGTLTFRKGHYTYTGSALGGGGVKGRVLRYLSSDKKEHWHIDYLLHSERAKTTSIICSLSHSSTECKISQKIEALSLKGGFKGFGASDCHSGCKAHLHYFPDTSEEQLIKEVSKIHEENGLNTQILTIRGFGYIKQ
jgi:Uri superfamily endonuclease